MSDRPPELVPTHTELGHELSLLAHELHNILTVFYGVVEELEVDKSGTAAQNAPILKAGVEKTEEVATTLFELRKRLLHDQSIRPLELLGRVPDQLEHLEPLRPALAEAPDLCGDESAFELLLITLAQTAAAGGGLRQAMLRESPTDLSRKVRLELSMEGGKPPEPLLDRLERVVAGLGGTLETDGEGLLTLELLSSRRPV